MISLPVYTSFCSMTATRPRPVVHLVNASPHHVAKVPKTQLPWILVRGSNTQTTTEPITNSHEDQGRAHQPSCLPPAVERRFAPTYVLEDVDRHSKVRCGGV